MNVASLPNFHLIAIYSASWKDDLKEKYICSDYTESSGKFYLVNVFVFGSCSPLILWFEKVSLLLLLFLVVKERTDEISERSRTEESIVDRINCRFVEENSTVHGTIVEGDRCWGWRLEIGLSFERENGCMPSPCWKRRNADSLFKDTGLGAHSKDVPCAASLGGRLGIPSLSERPAGTTPFRIWSQKFALRFFPFSLLPYYYSAENLQKW